MIFKIMDHITMLRQISNISPFPGKPANPKDKNTNDIETVKFNAV